jgi:hypothetical protein
MKIEEAISNKKVLYIPILSMRDYTTGYYDLMADGNVNRFISKLSKVENADIIITLPIKVKNEHFIHSLLNLPKEKNVNISYWHTDYYLENANSTRKNKQWVDILELYKNLNFDLLIFEPNIIGTFKPEVYFKEVIYWCPVSNTSERTVSFVDEFAELDKQNAAKYTTFVCTNSQKEFLGKNAIVDSNVMDVKLFDKWFNHTSKTFFIPFRQSDAGYKITEIYTILKELEKSYVFDVLYTAPNNFINDIKLKNMTRVSSDRKTYYDILSKNPCIPFLEDTKNILHMSIFEFEYFNCPVIGYPNDIVKFKYEINDISELKNKIIEYLNS